IGLPQSVERVLLHRARPCLRSSDQAISPCWDDPLQNSRCVGDTFTGRNAKRVGVTSIAPFIPAPCALLPSRTHDSDRPQHCCQRGPGPSSMLSWCGCTADSSEQKRRYGLAALCARRYRSSLVAFSLDNTARANRWPANAPHPPKPRAKRISPYQSTLNDIRLKELYLSGAS